MRTCLVCQVNISGRHHRAKYCGPPCKKRAELLRDREVRKERNREWRREHPEYNLSWQRANREKVRANCRRSYRRNRKQGRDKIKVLWVNPQTERAYETRRIEPGISGRDWRKTLQRFGYSCAYCGAFCGAVDVEMSYVVPVSRGGKHTIGNVLPACFACVKSKGVMLLSEWLRMGVSHGGR